MISYMDVAKDYDSPHQHSLFEAMEAIGAGPGLLSWARLPLSDIASRAVVIGFTSDRGALTAGVRHIALWLS